MKNWSLNRKFSAILGIFATTSIVIASIGGYELHELNDTVQFISGTVATRVSLVKGMGIDINAIRNKEKLYILQDTDKDRAANAAALEVFEKKLVKGMEEFKELAIDAGRKDMETMAGLLKDWKQAHSEVLALASSGHQKEATALAVGRSGETLAKIEQLLERAIERNEGMLREEKNKSIQLYIYSRNLMAAVSVLSILAGLVIAFFVLRSLNRTIEKLISELGDNSNHVSSASVQISHSSQELSAATSEQAASLEQTASAIEEISSMVKKNSENSTKASDLSSSSEESALKGKKVVEEMVRAMEEINTGNTDIMNQINASNQQISDIVKVIAEIGNKTKVINDIVFQTKLLSFNASVEAARAGEHGKGFAVVAQEVGNLAQMSGNAAKEISSMLEESIRKVEGIVNQTKSQVETLVHSARTRVDVGNRVARQCGQVLDEIVGNVANLSQMAREIATASQEQSQGIQEVTTAVSQLDQVTQQNAANSEQTANAAESLSTQALSLRSSVETLIHAIRGGEASPETARVEAATGRGAAAAAGAGQGKVLAFRKNEGTPAIAKAGEKKVVNLGQLLPSESDPRFQEV